MQPITINLGSFISRILVTKTEQRFQTARLNATVMEGELEDGIYFIVMEMLNPLPPLPPAPQFR